MQNEFIDVPNQEIPVATKEEVKFMQLLNEYLLKYYAEHGNKNLYMELGWWSVFNVHEIVIISKRFWFIKRLLNNNKIDTGNIDLCLFASELWIPVGEDTIIMQLAVSKHPIIDLKNILK